MGMGSAYLCPAIFYPWCAHHPKHGILFTQGLKDPLKLSEKSNVTFGYYCYQYPAQFVGKTLSARIFLLAQQYLLTNVYSKKVLGFFMECTAQRKQNLHRLSHRELKIMLGTKI